MGRSAAGAAVGQAYEAMLAQLGPEFAILRELPLEDIRRVAGPCVAEGVRRVRAGELRWEPGFDGEYGRVEILSRDEIGAFSGQLSFDAPAPVILPRATAPGQSARPARRQKPEKRRLPRRRRRSMKRSGAPLRTTPRQWR